jgi:hypothetical protein
MNLKSKYNGYRLWKIFELNQRKNHEKLLSLYEGNNYNYH